MPDSLSVQRPPALWTAPPHRLRRTLFVVPGGHRYPHALEFPLLALRGEERLRDECISVLLAQQTEFVEADRGAVHDAVGRCAVSEGPGMMAAGSAGSDW